MTLRAKKKIIFVGALAAAAGLTSCADLSYTETDGDGTASAPAAVVSVPDERTYESSAAEKTESTPPDVPDSVTVLDGLDSEHDKSEVTEITTTETSVTEITESSAETSAPDSFEEPGGGGDGTIEITPQYVAFCEIIEEYRSRFGAGTELNSEFCRYYVTDIDGDGVYELIAETGTFEADRTAYVFAFDGQFAMRCGDFVTWHAEICQGDGCIYSVTQAMGSSIYNEIRLANGVVVDERLDDGFNEMSGEPLRYYTYDDFTGLDILLEKPPASWLDIYN